MRKDSNWYESYEDPLDEIEWLLEEAKTMWTVGSYHENIVNLQGITVGVINAALERVCCLFRLIRVNYQIFLNCNHIF